MREQSIVCEKIGTYVMEKRFPELLEQGVRIAWLYDDTEKMKQGKTIYAECEKVNQKYQWCCHYDFMITVYEPNVASFDDRQMEILLEHELMHVGINQDGEEPVFYVVPHDVEEFRAIIDRYGIDWSDVDA